MASIESIDTSVYSNLIERVLSSPTHASVANAIAPITDDSTGEEQKTPFNLNNYYDEVRPNNLLDQVGNNVIVAAEALSNAMVSAVQNGFSVQDACNLKLAEAAYKATSSMMKSTFELDV